MFPQSVTRTSWTSSDWRKRGTKRRRGRRTDQWIMSNCSSRSKVGDISEEIETFTAIVVSERVKRGIKRTHSKEPALTML